MPVNGSLQTDDLALAVYLIAEGHAYELKRGVREHDGAYRRTAFWVFSDDTQDMFVEYRAGNARVDPNKFVRTWGVVRKEMLDFLNNT